MTSVALAPFRFATAIVTAGSDVPAFASCDTYVVASPNASVTSATLRTYTGAPPRVATTMLPTSAALATGAPTWI